MTVRLVTYDLRKPGQLYNAFYKTLHSYPYAKLSESSYAVETQETPQQVYDKLAPSIDKNDQIYIISLSRPLWYLGNVDVNKWLEARL